MKKQREENEMIDLTDIEEMNAELDAWIEEFQKGLELDVEEIQKGIEFPNVGMTDIEQARRIALSVSFV